MVQVMIKEGRRDLGHDMMGARDGWCMGVANEEKESMRVEEEDGSDGARH